MAVEVFKSSTSGNYANMRYVCFDFAKFFSLSTNFEVIDSYSTITGRYIGDPYADGIWASGLDCSDQQEWIIVRALDTIHTTLGLPAWEAKFQFIGNNYTYLIDPSDPTGVKYPKCVGSPNHRNVFVRFCPWGGWDCATVTPDFNPVITGMTPSPYPSTDNHRMDISYISSISDSRWYMITDVGQVAFIVRDNQTSYRIGTLGGVLGDVLRVSETHMPMPRALLTSDGRPPVDTSFVAHLTNSWVPGDSNISGSSDYAVSSVGVGSIFFDDTLTLIQQGFYLPTFNYVFGSVAQTQPNQYASPNFEMDFFPYMPIPDTRKGLWFSVPMIRLGAGIGYHPINNKSWMSMGFRYCLYVKWDGTTNLYD